MLIALMYWAMFLQTSESGFRTYSLNRTDNEPEISKHPRKNLRTNKTTEEWLQWLLCVAVCWQSQESLENMKSNYGSLAAEIMQSC